MEALDQLNDMIEELTKKADAQDETDKMKVDLEMQIERATKDVELSLSLSLYFINIALQLLTDNCSVSSC